MRDPRYFLKPHYTGSRALIIGIDKYRHVSQLALAASDARGVKGVLVDRFGFDESSVVMLIDEQATRDQILKTFLSFRNAEVDERLFFFFAGHGHTITGSRGDVGFLVPVDGRCDDPATMIRWDELTRGAELLPPKHVLFVMDACYGGLALQRSGSGGARFLIDMYKRYSRQVITAGKANEPVADGGGPLPGHSMFTGHFIEALLGKAEDSRGIISASGVMAHVFNNVATDKNSQQTPHFGHIEGDGEFIFKAPELSVQQDSEGASVPRDELWLAPFVDEADLAPRGLRDKVAEIKDLLGDESASIRLHDFVVAEVRKVLGAIGEDNFPVQLPVGDAEVVSRIEEYQNKVLDLSVVLSCVSYWASSASRQQILKKALLRSIDRIDSSGGAVVWLRMRWYPLILLAYSCGIAAIEAGNYNSLASIMLTSSEDERTGEQLPLAQLVASASSELSSCSVFKKLPGLERKYTPMSEHLLQNLQPLLEDALFLGRGYEKAFDRFEIMLALVVADLNKQAGGNPWGPVGRFGWKYRGHSSPFREFVSEAKAMGAAWPALRAGFFGGNAARFAEIASDYEKNMLERLGWW